MDIFNTARVFLNATMFHSHVLCSIQDDESISSEFVSGGHEEEEEGETSGSSSPSILKVNWQCHYPLLILSMCVLRVPSLVAVCEV